MKVIRLKEEDIKKLVKKVLEEESKQLNEMLLPLAALLAYRQTAFSKGVRLTRKIKNNLKARGIKNKIIEDGNLNQLMKCINGTISDVKVGGKTIKQIEDGKARMDKGLTKKSGHVFNLSYNEFQKGFSEKVKLCCKKFNIDDKTCAVIEKVVLSTIKDFSEKKFRL